MNEMPRISVIVPVYRVEKYLPQCLDSIVGQSYKDLEIILIDDGSPDKCGEICDEYAVRDERIMVIHKENSGLSAARNDGIDRAAGDWIAFVDSDDWCEPDYYEKLLEAAGENAPDVIIAGGYYKEYHQKRKEVRHFNEACFYKDKEHLEDLRAQITVFGLPWDKLYRASFLKENGFRYDASVRACEDFLFNFQVFDKAGCVGLVPAIGYHYRQVAASIANGFNPDKPEINYAFLSRLHDSAAESIASEKIRDGFNAVAMSTVAVSLKSYFFHPKNPKKKTELYKELYDMIDRPYYREAVYSPSDRYLSTGQLILKHTLRTRRGGVLRVLYTAKQRIMP